MTIRNNYIVDEEEKDADFAAGSGTCEAVIVDSSNKNDEKNNHQYDDSNVEL
eukprot:CAMPEP_0194187820 /NCGR_PEP_ID=MMETSP0154-20130528/52531_1 /TAXON_ID=1049557 /ORGANISM="Thalassiothrix antarctica, Strain L6-D1" /LENGTH=51 /DNA_ID=CAMNT_0038907799 /DNA_START=78 /DNA_END=230 /DNA_ORIENTATION=+